MNTDERFVKQMEAGTQAQLDAPQPPERIYAGIIRTGSVVEWISSLGRHCVTDVEYIRSDIAAHVHDFKQIEGQSSLECACGAVPDYEGIAARSEGEAVSRILYQLDGLNTIRSRDEFGQVCDTDEYLDKEQVLAIINDELPASAPAGDEVERAVVELREMFPDGSCSIDHSYRAGFGSPPDNESTVYENTFTVWVNSWSATEWTAATLAEAMQAVREFAGKEKS